MNKRAGRYPWFFFAVQLAAVGCHGPMSALDPAGTSAEQIARLFWWMTGVSLLIWGGVLALSIWAVRARGGQERLRQARYIILAGALTPIVVLGGLLSYGLTMLAEQVRPAPEGSLRIRVYGEQWWWRFRYEPPGRQPFEVANELKLPAGEAVQLTLHSHNVIHSFWIPSLGGKMDLIPGRVNQLALRPTRTGVFRGACAEYCGTGHAQMGLMAVVLSREDFHRWLERESRPQIPAGPEAAQP